MFAAVGLVGFGAAGLVIRRHDRSDVARPLWRTLALGTGAGLAAWALALVFAAELVLAIF